MSNDNEFSDLSFTIDELEAIVHVRNFRGLDVESDQAFELVIAETLRHLSDTILEGHKTIGEVKRFGNIVDHAANRLNELAASSEKRNSASAEKRIERHRRSLRRELEALNKRRRETRAEIERLQGIVAAAEATFPGIEEVLNRIDDFLEELPRLERRVKFESHVATATKWLTTPVVSVFGLVVAYAMAEAIEPYLEKRFSYWVVFFTAFFISDFVLAPLAERLKDWCIWSFAKSRFQMLIRRQGEIRGYFEAIGMKATSVSAAITIVGVEK